MSLSRFDEILRVVRDKDRHARLEDMRLQSFLAWQVGSMIGDKRSYIDYLNNLGIGPKASGAGAETRQKPRELLKDSDIRQERDEALARAARVTKMYEQGKMRSAQV